MKKILTLLLFVPFFSNATEYYIANSGSNTIGTGTSLNPWQTLAFAVTQVSSGDRINFANGTYNQTSVVDIPVGVSLRGNVSDTSAVILTGDMTGFLTPILALNSATQGTNGNQTISYIKFDGQNFATSVAISVFARGNIDIQHCSFRSFFHCAIIATGHTSFFPNNTPPATYAADINISYNRAMECGGFDDYGFATLWAHGTERLIVEHNDFQNMSRADGENGWAIKLLDFHKGTKIKYNTLKRKSFPYSGGGVDNYWDFTIESADNQGLEIAYNDIQGSVDVNRQSKGTYPYSVYIHHNNIGQPSTPAHPESGIVLEYNTIDAIIDSNYLFNLSAPIFFSFHDSGTVDTIKNVRITGNYIKNSGSSQSGGGFGEHITFHANDGDYWRGDSIYIDNNTMTGNATYKVAWGISLSHCNGVNFARIRNNIVTNVANGWLVSGASNLISNIHVTNNCSDGNGYSDEPAWISGNPSGYTYTDNLVDVDPLIVADTLSASSPCIDAGIDIGIPFNGSAPDMGYRESRIRDSTIADSCANIPITANAGIDQIITLPTNSISLPGSGTASTLMDTRNIVLYSEDLTNGVYHSTNSTATANQANDLLGNPTLEEITSTYGASNDVYTDITVVPSTTYYVSWDVKRGTCSDLTYSFYDFTNFAQIVAPTSYYTLTSSTVTRVHFIFTAPSGCTTVRFAPFGVVAQTGTAYIGRLQVALSECDKYATTTSSAVFIAGGAGTINGYTWSKVSGPSAGSISNTTSTGLASGLVAGVYTFKLDVTDTNSQTADDEVQVTVNEEPGMAPITKNEEIIAGNDSFTVTAMPNPSSNYFVLAIKTINTTKTISVILMDVTGRIVETKNNAPSSGQILVGHKLPAGVYFAQVIQGSEKKLIRLVKL